jgi:polyhydroxyalkanoate synthesis regulator protein
MSTLKIKRYKNRRLWDIDNAWYVNVPEIAKHVAEGGDVEVVSFEAGVDLTSHVLATVVVEWERSGRVALTVESVSKLLEKKGVP